MSDAEATPTSRWTEATSGVRSAASWLATAFGAAAAAVFGAGPIFATDVDTGDWGTARWIAALTLVVLGTAAVAFVIARLLALQVPIEVTLDRIPTGLRERIEANDLGEYLPGEAKTLNQFKNELKAHSIALAKLRAAAANTDDPTRKADLESRATIQENNFQIYLDKREELYRLAAYELEASRLTPRATRPWLSLGAAAIVGVFAMAAFSLITGSDVKKEEADDKPDPLPSTGILLKNQENDELWNAAGLAGCERPRGQVPVFVLAAESSTYKIQTLGLPRTKCQRYALTVPRDQVSLVQIEPRETTVTPAPQ